MKKHTFLVSDESLNRYGYRVLTDGIDTTQFKKNPVGYLMHNRKTWDANGDEVIVRWEELTVKDGKMYATAVFDEDNEHSMKVYKKVENGFLRMASIGIDPKETSTDKKHLVAGQQYGTVTKSELLEISIVDRGGNNNALKLYGKDGQELIKLPKINTLNMELVQRLQGTLNLSDGDENAINEAVKTAVSDAAKYKKLYDDKMAEETAARATEASTLIKQLKDEKIIGEDAGAPYEALFAADHDNAKAVVSGMLAAKTPATPAAPPAGGDALNTFLKDVGGNAGAAAPDTKQTFDYLSANDPKELKRLKDDEPETFKKLVADYAKGVRQSK